MGPNDMMWPVVSLAPCSYCSQPARRPCVTKNGYEMHDVHEARALMYQAMRRVERRRKEQYAGPA